jgi:radical SAM superfamily enzyme YgiQ (UPF0313 family)
MKKNIAFVHPEVRFRPYGALGTRPLGVLSLATTLNQAHPDWDIRCYDENSRSIMVNGQINEKFLLGADVVGISGLTSTAPRAYALADRLRELRAAGKTNPQLRVIMGGMHATAVPNEVIEHADVVVRGEAEQEIIGLVESGEDGIIVGKRNIDLDKLVNPDYALLDYKKRRLADYFYGDLASVSSTRGCSFKCDFCSVWSTFGPTRIESAEKTFSKLKELREQNFRRVFFHDDNFSEKSEYRENLFRLLEDKPLGMSYIVQDRIDLLQDGDYVRRLAKSGCSMVMFSVESPNPEFLKAHNKELDLGKVDNGVSLLRKNGITPYAFCMIEPENPGQTKDTIRFLRDLRIKYAQFTIVTPMPGTVLYHKMKDKIHEKGWQYYNGLSLVTEKAEKAKEAAKNLSNAWKEFYSPIRSVGDVFKFQLTDAVLRLYGWRIGRQILHNQPI